MISIANKLGVSIHWTGIRTDDFMDFCLIIDNILSNVIDCTGIRTYVCI